MDKNKDQKPSYTRMQAKDRRAQIVEAGLTLAREDGLTNLKRQTLADYIGINRGGITYHFGDMESLRDAVVSLAIERKELKIIGQAIVLQLAAVARISDDLRSQAIAELS